MRYYVPKEIKSSPKVWKNVGFDTFMAMIVLLAVAMIFENLVYEKLVPEYYIFSVLTSLVFLLPSKDNPKRRLYQTLLITIKRQQDHLVYKPLRNVSKKRGTDRNEIE